MAEQVCFIYLQMYFSDIKRHQVTCSIKTYIKQGRKIAMKNTAQKSFRRKEDCSVWGPGHCAELGRSPEFPGNLTSGNTQVPSAARAGPSSLGMCTYTCNFTPEEVIAWTLK